MQTIVEMLKFHFPWTYLVRGDGLSVPLRLGKAFKTPAVKTCSDIVDRKWRMLMKMRNFDAKNTVELITL
jgi:hypothetical protein